ncbi:MAG: hypothetical protein JRJ41_01005 [Deltaproteobacteria bacterium]|nr:hypothetical protein [Deltaproteobacteria bacterium]
MKFIISNILSKRMVWVLALTGTIFVTFVSSAEADCVDAFAMVARVLPLTWGWIIFSIVWYLALTASASVRKEKVFGILSLRAAFLLVIILIIVGVMMLGPAPMFLLLVLSIIGTIGAVFKKAENSNPLFKKDMKVIGGFVLLSLLGLGSGSLSIRFTRTPSDYILKWRHTYPARAALADLLKSGPEALPDLRVIVEKGSPPLIVQAAERLAVIGEPQVDVPLLLNALSSTDSAKVESALRLLSGLELPENTAVKIWREEWQKSLQQSVLKRKNQ